MARDTTDYTAFGLTVASEMPLSGFGPPQAIAGEPDVWVRSGPPRVGHDSRDRVAAIAGGVLRASVWNGEEITVEAVGDADPDYVSAIVTGELFSVLLRQRGHLVVHGSGVARDGRSIGFVGDSGWGKSTLAAALVARGWSFLTDDLLVITEGDGGPVLIPTHSSMRLSEEAAVQVDAVARARGRAHALTTKLEVDQAGAFSASRVPLSRLFVLWPVAKPAHRAVPMSPRDLTLELVGHTRGQRLLKDLSVRQAHLAQCARVARSVPGLRLERKPGLDHLDALCDLVEAKAADE